MPKDCGVADTSGLSVFENLNGVTPDSFVDLPPGGVQVNITAVTSSSNLSPPELNGIIAPAYADTEVKGSVCNDRPL